MAGMALTDEQLAWLTLSRTGLDATALRSALDAAGSAAALVCAGDAWCEREGIPATARAYLRQRAPPTRAELRWLDGSHHHVIPFTDPRYPRLLAGLDHRPVALYAAGNLGALGEPPFAAVGSRNPTRPGADTAFEFGRALAERGLAIVSGLAFGIDTAAHRGALAAQGVTIAVLGSGADIVYPAANRELAESIQHEGLLLSEFPLGTPPRRANFPRRNRVLAGLSKAILVVEAARGSGSLITARAARDLGRPVFAVPGSIYNPLSRGCHELIKGGAKLAETADDILSELDFSTFFSRGSGGAHRGACGAAENDADASGMDKDHKILLDALGFDPADLDMLIVRTGFKPEAVSSMMLILELEGHVQAAPGGRYSRVANRRAGGER
jgi:DNA processing protein